MKKEKNLHIGPMKKIRSRKEDQSIDSIEKLSYLDKYNSSPETFSIKNVYILGKKKKKKKIEGARNRDQAQKRRKGRWRVRRKRKRQSIED